MLKNYIGGTSPDMPVTVDLLTSDVKPNTNSLVTVERVFRPEVLSRSAYLRNALSNLVLAVLVAFLFLSSAHAWTTPISLNGKPYRPPIKPFSCAGKFNGKTLSQGELNMVVERHRQWLQDDSKEGDDRKANLCGATLVGKLEDVDLSNADLSGAELANLHLEDVKLAGANLSWATMKSRSDWRFLDLSKANIDAADLRHASILFSNLRGAQFREADLRGAYLVADLREAVLLGTKLNDAELNNSNLSGAVFEIKADFFPDIAGIAYVKGLAYITYDNTPQALFELREAFRKVGLRQQEREITRAIKYAETKEDSDYVGVLVNGVFDLTCGWGMSPWRPLIIVLCILMIVSIVNLIFIVFGKDSGIWAVWPEDRLLKEIGGAPEKITLKHPRPSRVSESNTVGYRIILAWGTGLYFSLVSTFHIGGQYLNVGNWITRAQPNEYILKATGWARFVSGMQSIFSVFLIALWALTYFGRPFE